MLHLFNIVNLSGRGRQGLRWALIIVAALCVGAALYFSLFRERSVEGDRVGDTVASNSSEAYTDRWIAIDAITQSNAEPLAITELSITNDSDSLTVEMRGQKVDEVTNGNWTQKNCPYSCLLGIASARYTGDPAEVSIETAPGLVHHLTLTAKASTPGSDARLRVVDAVLLGGQTLATYSQEFVPHSLLHPERIIDQGIPNLR